MNRLALFAMLWPSIAHGLYDTTPWSYERRIGNGLSIVMIGPPLNSDEFWFIDALPRSVREREESIRARFPSSGLYDLSGSQPKPVWTFDRYSGGFEASRDGRFIVSLDYVWQEKQDRMIRFFDMGKLVAEQNITEILRGADYDEYRNPVAYLWWYPEHHEIVREETAVDSARASFRFMSLNGDVLNFDLQTGVLLNRYNLFDRILWLSIAGLLAICGIVTLLVRRHRFANQAANRTPQNPRVLSDRQ